jgi:hypothetical protein
MTMQIRSTALALVALTMLALTTERAHATPAC